MTPKENYLRMLKGEVPEFMPSYIEPHSIPIREELLTPNAVPDGPVITSLGVKYVGSEETNFGAMPEPNVIVIDDILKWRDQLKIRDVSGRDWEGYYKKQTENIDRENKCISIDGGDYFLTLVSLMGFEGALMAMYEEPDEVKAFYEHVSKFYTMVLKQQLHYMKPEIYVLMDDDAAYRAPFFSLDIYRDLIKPFHKLHCDIVRDAGCVVMRHDCGKSEQFIDDWIEIGVQDWNPVQTSNDCKAIKQKYVGKLALSGCWDTSKWSTKTTIDEKELMDDLVEYVDTFAPGGGFTFAAAMGVPMPNETEVSKQRREITTKFYYDYARDWYKRNPY